MRYVSKSWYTDYLGVVVIFKFTKLKFDPLTKTIEIDHLSPILQTAPVANCPGLAGIVPELNSCPGSRMSAVRDAKCSGIPIYFVFPNPFVPFSIFW